jgi:hypothetical protein
MTKTFRLLSIGTMAQKNILFHKNYNFFVIFEDAASSVPTFFLAFLAFLLCVFALSFSLFL